MCISAFSSVDCSPFAGIGPISMAHDLQIWPIHLKDSVEQTPRQKAIGLGHRDSSASQT